MAHATIEEWLNSADGVKMNPDRRYGLQCVDLVDQYAQDIFGVPWTESVGGVAGARQLLDRAPDRFWIRIDNDPNDPALLPQRGDVVVFAGDSSNGWGHTNVALECGVAGFWGIQQDGFAAPHQFVDGAWYSAKPAHKAWLTYDQKGTGAVAGWLRPRPEMLLAPEGGTEAITKCVVEEGDTMGLIAIQFGVSLDALIKANPKVKNPNLIKPGDVLNLPA